MELVNKRVLLYGELSYISPFNVTLGSCMYSSDRLLVLFCSSWELYRSKKITSNQTKIWNLAFQLSVPFQLKSLLNCLSKYRLWWWLLLAFATYFLGCAVVSATWRRLEKIMTMDWQSRGRYLMMIYACQSRWFLNIVARKWYSMQPMVSSSNLVYPQVVRGQLLQVISVTKCCI